MSMNRLRKPRALAALLAALGLLTALLTGCAGGGPPSATPTPAPPAEPTPEPTPEPPPDPTPKPPPGRGGLCVGLGGRGLGAGGWGGGLCLHPQRGFLLDDGDDRTINQSSEMAGRWHPQSPILPSPPVG